VNSVAVGLENDIESAPTNPLQLVKLKINPPWLQLKARGVNVERAADESGQAAALAGAAPAKAKVPAAAKRAAPSLKRLFMIWKVMETAAD
jgi:hypothetical protein